MALNPVASRSEASVLATNKVLRNTYMLLSMTLLFSAMTAALSIALRVPPFAYMFCVIGAFAMMWLVLPRTANSGMGIVTVFAITGLMGFGLGPIISMYLSLPNGPQIVATALGGTGVIFMALSGYALTTKRDFSFMGAFLFVGIMVLLGAMLLNFFLQAAALQMAIAAAFMLLMSGYILYDTSRIVHGGQTNYVVATVELYINIFNLFISLLQLIGFASDD